MKFAKAFAALTSVVALLVTQQAWASTPSCVTYTEPVTSCDNTEGQSNIKSANHPAFASVPFPVRITSITMADNAMPITTGQFGIWQIWLDPGSAYKAANPGYPNQQNPVPGNSMLAVMELQPGSILHVQRDLTNPMPWDSADSMIFDMPCTHTPGIPAWAADMWWSICWIKP
jgi:hypothetical protein